MANSRVFWMTKPDDEGSDEDIRIWTYACHPQIDEDGNWRPRNVVAGGLRQCAKLPMCAGTLALFTGITLARGQREKYRLVKQE